MTAATELLGGARRIKTRPRGFAPWSPEKATLVLLDQVRGVLDEYVDHLPLTIRQIFCRLVGAYEYEKSDRAYQRLIEHLNRARRSRNRAHNIPMDVIRDDTGIVSEPDHWENAEQFMATIRAMAKGFTLDHSIGQATRLIVICEAGGMVPQLERVAHPFGITVMSGGGFESLTDKHKFAAALSEHKRPTEVVDIGDHDPSGVSKFLAFLEDVEAFARELGGNVTFTRLCRDAGADRRIPATDSTAEGDRPARLQRPNLPGRGAATRRARQHPAQRHRGARRSACARSCAAPGAAHPSRAE